MTGRGQAFDPRSPEARAYFREQSRQGLIEHGLTSEQADTVLDEAEAAGRALATDHASTEAQP